MFRSRESGFLENKIEGYLSLEPVYTKKTKGRNVYVPRLAAWKTKWGNDYFGVSLSGKIKWMIS
jgi:hypothetical protein